MSALLAGRRMAGDTGASLVLRGAQPRVQRVFDISGLTDRFTFAPA
jgi:anti-anti-sigma regulatory factor